MVDFRYHLVSVIAIFLALALGIVVGTTQLNGLILDDLNGSVGQLAADKRGLETTIGELRDQAASDEVLAEALGPAAVAGRLAGQRVALVSAPGVPGVTREQLVPLLGAAGALVSSQVQLRPDLFDATKAAVLDDLVSRVAPDGLDLSGEVVDRVAAELGAALLAPQGEGGVSAAAADEIVGGFEQLDLIDVQELGERADLAVLLVDGPPEGVDLAGDPRVQGLLSVALGLDGAGRGAVVAGPLAGTQDGGVLRALREDRGMSAQVSSVDGAERPQGRLAVVLALREQVEGQVGRYGSGEGTSGPIPSLPPS